MKFKRLEFENRDGEALSAQLDFTGENTPMAMAIFAHCFTCTKNMRAVANISRALTNKGIAVFRFDFSGLGQSKGDFSETNFSSNVSDIVAAAEFLEYHYTAPKVLIGHSFGGAACLKAALDLPSVVAVVTIGSPLDPGHVRHLFGDALEKIDQCGEAELMLEGRPFKIKRQFVDDLEKTDMNKVLPELNRALLVMHSPADAIVDIENAALIYRAAKHPKSFISLDNADHMMQDPEDSRYAGSIIAEWAKKYINQSL